MKTIYLFIFVLIVLLFVGGPGYESHRIVTNIWDYGHVVLFFGLTSIFLSFKPLNNFKEIYIFLTILSLSLFLGLLIEIIQLLVERSFDLFDVLNDVYGAMIGYLISRYRTLILSVFQKRIIILLTVFLVVLSLSSLIKVIFDEYYMRLEFPVLADFESPFELTRWDTHLTSLKKSKIHVKNHQYSIRAIFYPGEFSDITLQHFVRDWSNYKKIVFSLYVEKQRTIELKIYDEAHIKNDYRYNDRFNKVIVLQSGWNDISLPLSEIINAPENRKMNITNIKSFSLFLTGVTKPVYLFLDSLMLK